MSKVAFVKPTVILLAAAIAGGGCGTPSTESAAGGRATVPANSTAEPQVVASAAPPDAEPIDDSLELAITSTTQRMRGTTADDDALFLVGNRYLHRYIADCLAAHDLEYSEFLFVKGLPGPMRSVRAYSASWPSPPDMQLARTVGLEPTHPTDPPIPESIPPNVFYESLDSVGQASYDRAQSECETSYSPPQHLAAAARLSQSIVAGFEGVEATSLLNPSFAPLQQRYAACMMEQGLQVGAPGEMYDLIDATRAEYSDGRSQDDLDVLHRKGIELAIVDAECRGPLYSEFLGLEAEAWRNWVSSSSADLDELETIRARIRAEASAIG